MTRHFTILLTAFVLFLSAIQVCAQKKGAPQLKEDVDLPSDFKVDSQLAAAERSSFYKGGGALISTQTNQIGEEVFRALIASSTISWLSLPYQWRLSLVDSGNVNAYSRADGEVSIETGMVKLIGSDRGLWAAVLSHEIEHVARRHLVKEHLYKVYTSQLIRFYEMRARQGDKSANWVLLGLRIAVPLAEKKLSRNHENEADVQGMMLMAATGYHPDNVFALHHMLEAQLGDSSKFVTFFFRDHPRWATRDQRAEKAYSGALAEYNQLWPDPDHSPGGQPPVVAFAGNPRATTDKVNGTADLELPLYCRNVSEPLDLVIHFSKDKHWLPSSNAQYRDSAGNLEVRQKIVCLDKEDAAPLDVHLPASLVPEKDRKTQAQAVVLASNGEVLERFKSLDVYFPKSDVKVGKPTSAPQTVVIEHRKAEIEESVNRAATIQPPPPTHDVAKPQESPRQQPTDSAAQSYVSRQAVDTPPSQEIGSTLGVVGSTDGTYGVKIISVTPSSPASKAGLVAGDIFMAVNGTKVNDERALDAEFANREPGSKIIATIMHGSWTYNVTITTEVDFSNSDHSFGLLFPGHASKLDR